MRRCNRSGPEDHTNIDDDTPEQHEDLYILQEAPNDPCPEAHVLSNLENLFGSPADGACDIARYGLHDTLKLYLSQQCCGCILL